MCLILIRVFFFLLSLERSQSETGHFFVILLFHIKYDDKADMEVCALLPSSVSPCAYETKGYLTLWLGGGGGLPPTTTTVSPSPREAENAQARFLAHLAHGPWESVTHPSLSTGSAYG